jgi:type VI secretion system secreted protein Hcp
MKVSILMKLLLVNALGLVLALPSISKAAFVTAAISGQTSGQIKGDNTARGQEGTIVVLGAGLELNIPTDTSSGLPTGRTQLKPLKITKPLDKATPRLFNAAVNNELLTDVLIKFYHNNPAGLFVHYYTIKLRHARITSITANEDGQVANGMVETIYMTFETMEITDVVSGNTALIAWGPPSAK